MIGFFFIKLVYLNSFATVILVFMTQCSVAYSFYAKF